MNVPVRINITNTFRSTSRTCTCWSPRMQDRGATCRLSRMLLPQRKMREGVYPGVQPTPVADPCIRRAMAASPGHYARPFNAVTCMTNAVTAVKPTAQLVCFHAATTTVPWCLKTSLLWNPATRSPSTEKMVITFSSYTCMRSSDQNSLGKQLDNAWCRSSDWRKACRICKYHNDKCVKVRLLPPLRYSTR